MKVSSILTDSITQKKVPRPLNCFMTFRLEKQREIMKKFPGANHRDISKIIAKWWKELSPLEKEPYKIQAEKAKNEHSQLYPHYKFQPKKKVTKTRAYKMRPNSQYTLQDLETKRQVLALRNDKRSVPTTSNEDNGKINHQQHNIHGNQQEYNICCAPCLSSHQICFPNTYGMSALEAERHREHHQQFSMYNIPSIASMLPSNVYNSPSFYPSSYGSGSSSAIYQQPAPYNGYFGKSTSSAYYLSHNNNSLSPPSTDYERGSSIGSNREPTDSSLMYASAYNHRSAYSASPTPPF